MHFFRPAINSVSAEGCPLYHCLEDSLPGSLECPYGISNRHGSQLIHKVRYRHQRGVPSPYALADFHLLSSFQLAML